MDEREQILIIRAQQRDPQAFEILENRHDRQILGLAL